MKELRAEAVPEKKKKGYDDWEIDDALRTLTRAEEINNDPELMKLVDKKIKEQQEALTKIEMRKELLYGGKNESKGN